MEKEQKSIMDPGCEVKFPLEGNWFVDIPTGKVKKFFYRTGTFKAFLDPEYNSCSFDRLRPATKQEIKNFLNNMTPKEHKFYYGYH